MKNLDYGIIGNCRSAALVSKTGSVEWLCLPHFAAPSTFARILDDKKGGFFSVKPVGDYETEQFYISRTNILVTKFTCESGVFELHDFMPRYRNEHGVYYTPPDIVRYIKHISGSVNVVINFEPKLVYAMSNTAIDVEEEYIKAYTTDGEYDSVYLYSSFDKKSIKDKLPVTIKQNEYLLLSYNQKLLKQSTNRSYLKHQRTKVYWLNWSDKTTSFKSYEAAINRSALTLKLLNYQKSGAILAALTTSLPETIGEVRNWDYRFCWIRDASMVVKIMTELGHERIAERYLNFIISLMPDKGQKMQIMYGIHGEKELTEVELDHLAGYEGSKPVRIGNAAYVQKQNDIYGILMDVVLQYFERFRSTLGNSEDLWTIVRNIVKVVDENWQEPDKGIWEIRSEGKHFTFSKVLCWVAIDRARKIATLLKRDTYAIEWKKLEEKIAADIHKNAWSDQKHTFTQSYGSNDLDAAVLLMETYGFIKADDQRYKKTVLAIQKELEHDGLMYRYKNEDDFGEPQSAFTICSFWLINSLYKIGLKDEAKRKFDALLACSNHLGLFSEDLDFKTRRLLGNFPQAYSHLAIIETAITLSGAQISKEAQIMKSIHH
ncbi:glycoside hydrolase family 15 protein [Carboxylicivirga mesophila]|uniref:Glycoside hydrolase family 15 protein n=1 Tax=Carboxylicivirga mesophila TaxID=1166478 RepID=A0ABS5KI84_9BACT|nr:glycoside hydrolase family 15 protein [Carboxylicivirga mesophila]MBS2213768.1 glycoside hydrolase family 15 protein [Carboxylicivirga mesophila]